ncbi:rho GTPase-activating protein 24 [Salmo salar]|uniref:Rho GTPase-activating protein 24 n=1 Tax=Salmo salar TaxID=8030 RepID=A0A1S3RT87_SALSA|nr:rho GTPase-activating protein 24-like [Salmo salar]
MELPCLPTETPTTASSCSTDPLYDNCLPHAGRGRDRGFREMEKEIKRESGGLCNPAVTGILHPSSPPGLAPAAAVVPTLGRGRDGRGGVRGAGVLPAHSHCSWGGLGRQGWDMGTNRGERGRERGGGNKGVQEVESVRHQQSPSPSHSDTHESALSVYDNLHAVTPTEDAAMETTVTFPTPQRFPRIPVPVSVLMEDGGVSGESSSWSSCEILLAGSSASNGPDQYQDLDPELDFNQDEPTFQLQPLIQPQPHRPDNFSHLQPLVPPLQASAAHPVEPLQPSGPIPVPGARVPPPLPLADPSASALRSLLTSLQQQIARQREEYEERIHSLEERNEALQVEVLDLRANLAQQRRWYSVVQAKILESERGRAAADLRNAALQREMEQFFDTFGELSNEAKKTEKIVRSF